MRRNRHNHYAINADQVDVINAVAAPLSPEQRKALVLRIASRLGRQRVAVITDRLLDNIITNVLHELGIRR